MAASQLNYSDVTAVRDRLIVCCRLLALHRGIDLSRTLRAMSEVDGKFFVLIRRKGWRNFKWEQVIALPQAQSISHFHLMLHYVQMTKMHMAQGDPRCPFAYHFESSLQTVDIKCHQ